MVNGKSEILEMIGFAFFGSVALRDVRTVYKKLEVEIVFNFAGNRLKIIRTTSDASLLLYDNKKFEEIVNSTTYVNAKIIALLGYDFAVYKLSNYCEQGELQYISKMGSSNRIKFIDKVSGIEDAKDLMKFLEDNRKRLVSETNTLKKLLNPPEQIDDYIFNTDFEPLIETVNLKVLEINELNKELTKFETRVKLVQSKPVISKAYNPFYGEMSEEKYEEYYNTISSISEIEADILKLKDKLNYYNSIPIKYRKCTLDDVEQSVKAVLNNRDLSTKKTLLSTGDSVCPSCSFVYPLAYTALDKYKHVHEVVVPIIEEHFISDVRHYIKSNRQIVETLEINIKDQEILFKNLIQTLPESIRQLTLREFKNNYISNLDILTEYNILLDHWIEESNNIVYCQGKITEIKALLGNNDLSQLFKDKELLIQQRTKKNDFITRMTSYMESKDVYDQLYKQLITFTATLERAKNSSDVIKKNSIPLINHHSSLLLNEMTDGEMNSIQVQDNYDILVEGSNITVKSGSEKDIASLAFRLSLGNSVIPGMLKLFIGDEIDSSSSKERTEYITDALTKLGNSGYQVILISHKDLDNVENAHIIDLQKI